MSVPAMNRALVAVSILMTCCTCPAVPLSEHPLPTIESRNGRFQLMVDDHPFLILGGQVHNSTTADEARYDCACAALEKIQANTAFVPLYWELLEPQEGQFDFTLVERAVLKARAHRLRVVLLWFGAWKNGAMHYAPEWVKRDKARFPRVIGARGEELPVLSPLADAARLADAAAFRAMLGHLRQMDASDRTVVMVQVENETGFLGTDRDYSSAGTKCFQSSVPQELTACLADHRAALSAPLANAWGENGNRSTGTWAEVFGDMGAEACTGWNIARHVESVVAAGKEEYPLPMYANAWLAEGNGERAGVWPSGGPNENMLDLWKCAAPHLDFLAPDIYTPRFTEVCAAYARPDNPLLIPEVSFDPYYPAFAFTAFARFDALAYSVFGIDDVFKASEPFKSSNGQDPPGMDETYPAVVQLARVYAILRPLLPLIARRQCTGTLFPVVQNVCEGADAPVTIRLGDKLAAKVTYTVKFDEEKQRGAGMIVKLAKDEFLIAGMGFETVFRELEGPPRDAEILSIDAGTFTNGQWTPQGRLNGDEQHLSLPESGRILRVKLLR